MEAGAAKPGDTVRIVKCNNANTQGKTATVLEIAPKWHNAVPPEKFVYLKVEGQIAFCLSWKYVEHV
jgi:hypothetical protein